MLAFLALAATAAAAPTRPNILVLIADDLGYGDLGCYGGTAVPTPRIDALASSGMRLTGFCTASAVCTPTRASLLTGRYPLRFGITRHFSDGPEHLPRGTPTLPAILRAGGYMTMHIGKWHLGGLRPTDAADRTTGLPGPREHGFDHYLAMVESAGIRGPLVRSSRLFRDGARHLLRDDSPADLSPAHLTEVEADEAGLALERFATRPEPFYLQVWFDTPHKPYEPASAAVMDPLPGSGTADERLYRGMIAHLDVAVGRILDRLNTLGLAENTVVIFSSDNGPTGPGSPGPFRGGKGTLFEGGIRVPFVAAWPGRIPAARVTEAFALSTDLVPTLLEFAAVAAPASLVLDGHSLAPLLSGRAQAPERGPAFWHLSPPYAAFHNERSESAPYATDAVRHGPWKLLARDGHPVALFNLGADPAERTDELARHPAEAARLQAALAAWLAEPRQSPLAK